jgi:hypothetical protein
VDEIVKRTRYVWFFRFYLEAAHVGAWIESEFTETINRDGNEGTFIPAVQYYALDAL